MKTIRFSKKIGLITLITLLGLTFMTPLDQVWANISSSGRFEKELVYEQVDFKLQGTALLRYLVFLKAYSGALYLPENTEPGQLFNMVPKRLTLEYHLSIKASDLAEATTALIRKNLDDDQFDALQNRIDRFNRLYLDVGPEDRYSLTYIPNMGTELSLNGKSLGIIEGHDFSEAVFAIWLGENPIDESFRDQLLGMVP